jgi:hypothetical protein
MGVNCAWGKFAVGQSCEVSMTGCGNEFVKSYDQNGLQAVR